MQAPLGLAVIGGLVMSTFATLLVLPSIFAVVVGKKAARSPSIYPDDPESRALRPAGLRSREAARPRDRPRRGRAGRLATSGLRHDEAQPAVAPLAIPTVLSSPPADGDGLAADDGLAPATASEAPPNELPSPG